jgi:hypothetical protein
LGNLFLHPGQQSLRTETLRWFGKVAVVLHRHDVLGQMHVLDFAWPWLEDGALGVFLKGQDVDDELTEAAKYWRITVRKQPSRIDPKGCVLLVEEAHRADT